MQFWRNADPGYYDFQKLVGQTLLTWGGINAVLGMAAQLFPNPFIKQFGLQALVWGAIDAVIGLFGLRDARRKQAERAAIKPQARRFRVIVLVNALLDVGYISGGMFALRRANARGDRAGMGVGIIVQGAFLLLFDTALALLSGRWTR